MKLRTAGLRILIVLCVLAGALFVLDSILIYEGVPNAKRAATSYIERIQSMKVSTGRFPARLGEILNSGESVPDLVLYLAREDGFSIVIPRGGLDIYSCYRWDSKSAHWYRTSERGCTLTKSGVQ